MRRHYAFATIGALLVYGLVVVYVVSTNSPREQLLIVALLAVLEVVLSFDNAAINVKLLRRLSSGWQKAFLRVGILFAVAGMRLTLPTLVASICGSISPVHAARLAVTNPQLYAEYFQRGQLQLAVFGGVYLLQIFLSYVLQEQEDGYWLQWLERRLARVDTEFGKAGLAVFAIASTAVLALTVTWSSHAASVFAAGVISIALYHVVNLLNGKAGKASAKEQTQTGLTGWLALLVFLQLELQDATFSMDSVMGGFAFTQFIVLIMAGSAIGALYVRTMTIHLLSLRGLDVFPYVVRAAYWAIGVLPFMMWLHVPGAWTGGICTALLVAAFLHNLYDNGREARTSKAS